MIRRLLPLAVLFFLTLHATAQITWQPSFEISKSMARLDGQLVLMYIASSSCSQCYQMEKYVWTDGQIDSLAKKFTMIRVDVDLNQRVDSTYNIKNVPHVMILDAWGNTLEDQTGYQNVNRLVNIMQAYPADMQVIYDAKEKLSENSDEDYIGNYEVGLAYQKYLPLLQSPAKEAFYRESMRYLTSAEKIAEKAGKPVMTEKAVLAQCLSGIFVNEAGEAIQQLENKVGMENIDATNQGYGCYVLALAYHQLNDKRAYETYFARLNEIPGGSYFQRLLSQQLASDRQ